MYQEDAWHQLVMCKLDHSQRMTLDIPGVPLKIVGFLLVCLTHDVLLLRHCYGDEPTLTCCIQNAGFGSIVDWSANVSHDEVFYKFVSFTDPV